MSYKDPRIMSPLRDNSYPIIRKLLKDLINMRS